jgi:hypothetical protein
MTKFSMNRSDSPAKVVATQALSGSTVEDLGELLAAQTSENHRLIAENRILWDLLLFDLPGVNMGIEPIRPAEVNPLTNTGYE